MVLEKIFGASKKIEDRKDIIRETPTYKLAEAILREAIKRGCRSIHLKCQRKEGFSSDPAKSELENIMEELETDSAVKMRDRNYFWGISLKIREEEHLFMVPPVDLSIALINIFYSEKTAYKGKKCFALYDEKSSRKTIDKYLNLTLYWEKDSSLSIDFEEIK
jgi:hypothetical protein